ncbi:MAG: hypothetical protein JSW06_02535 [Thermoplasmatales archaeon]|nr:MAG: hypothetical protein JSW06_02535 [Thermoplasmatales archaeon]
MNKKILIGSIIAIAILVLVSFTGVIGYRSIDSDVKVSPLFNIRSSKAIRKESKDIVCDYVGKGAGCILSIPKRNETTSMIFKLLNKITKIYSESNELNIYNLNFEIFKLGINPERVNSTLPI